MPDLNSLYVVISDDGSGKNGITVHSEAEDALRFIASQPSQSTAVIVVRSSSSITAEVVSEQGEGGTWVS